MNCADRCAALERIVPACRDAQPRGAAPLTAVGGIKAGLRSRCSAAAGKDDARGVGTQSAAQARAADLGDERRTLTVLS
jgi:hypothetical protein